MVRPIMREPLFLAQKSEPATEADEENEEGAWNA